MHVEPSHPDRDVQRAASGDAEAFERLYRATVARIHTLARRMAGDDLADDLTQEVYLRAWKKLGTFRGEASFATWLHRLAVNLILSRRASARKREARLLGESWLASLRARAGSPGLRLDLERALGRLPDGARRVFVLYDMEGYSHDEVARAMGITTGTSKSQLHRARMLLRRYLN